MDERGETSCLARCFNQVFRTGLPLSLIVNRGGNGGDCKHCSYDPEHNEKCESYKPVFFYVLESVDNDK